jgi:hypothetical protein
MAHNKRFISIQRNIQRTNKNGYARKNTIYIQTRLITENATSIKRSPIPFIYARKRRFNNDKEKNNLYTGIPERKLGGIMRDIREDEKMNLQPKTKRKNPKYNALSAETIAYRKKKKRQQNGI